MHRRLLPNEKIKWYLQDIGLPLSGALIVAGSARLFFHFSGSRLEAAIFLIVISTLTLVTSMLLSNYVRKWAIGYCKNTFNKMAHLLNV